MNSTEYNMIKNVLTLRYSPSLETRFPKLTWSDFIEKQFSDPVEFIEKSVNKERTVIEMVLVTKYQEREQRNTRIKRIKEVQKGNNN